MAGGYLAPMRRHGSFLLCVGRRAATPIFKLKKKPTEYLNRSISMRKFQPSAPPSAAQVG